MVMCWSIPSGVLPIGIGPGQFAEMTPTPHRNDAADRRRSQLKRWIDELFGGSQAAFVASTNDGKTQVNQGELSGLLKAKSFGEKRARRLELQAGMPPGYLDSATAPGGDLEDATSPLQAQEPPPNMPMIGRSHAIIWPFHSVSYRRLMDLKRALGPRHGAEAIRELDKYLDVLVAKWERDASLKKNNGQ